MLTPRTLTVFLFGLALATVTSAAATAETGVMGELRVSVETFAIPRIDEQTPNRVVFVGDTVTMDVMNSVVAFPEADKASSSERPPSEWWTALVFELSSQGEKIEFNPTFARVVSEKTLSPDSGNGTHGWSSTVRFDLPTLPPGKYSLAVSLGGKRSAPTPFLVSTGTENEALAREYARFKVERSRDASELKKSLKEYGRHDPLNASIWIRLGDQALLEDSLDEAAGYFEKTIAAFEHRAAMFTERTELVDAIRAEQASIREVQNMLARCLRQPAELSVRLEADTVQPGKRYILADRRTGKTIQVVKSEK